MRYAEFARLRMSNVLVTYHIDNGYETVSDDSHANLYSDSVLSGSLKNLYLEVLLQPFEAQFD